MVGRCRREASYYNDAIVTGVRSEVDTEGRMDYFYKKGDVGGVFKRVRQ